MFEIDPQTAKAVESVARSPYTAGFLGGVVLAIQDWLKRKWLVGLSNIVIGTIVAGLFATPAADFLGAKSDEWKSGIAGFIAIFGLNIAQAVVDSFKKWIANFDWSSLIPFSGGKSKDKHDE